MKIVVLDGYTVVQDDLSWDELKQFGELTYHERTSVDQVASRVKDADIIITSKCLIDKNVIDSAPNLKYIGVIATGYNNIDISYANKNNITVTNIPAYSTDSVAQFTFSLILEIVNHVGIHNDSVHRGEWENSIDFCYCLTPQTELAGKTMGIVGYGNIGQKSAQIAKAFGMKVLVHSSHRNSADNTEDVSFVEINELLKTSDIISLHCALTGENKEMINKDSLALIKEDAILINTSRGPLINENDLAESLKSGKLRAAGLDVLPEEPPKSGSPLTKLGNCIITPHIAWDTKEARQRLIGIAVENISSYINGKPINLVL